MPVDGHGVRLTDALIALVTSPPVLIPLALAVALAWARLLGRSSELLIRRVHTGGAAEDVASHGRAKRQETLLNLGGSLLRYAGFLAAVLYGIDAVSPSRDVSLMGGTLLVACLGFAAQPIVRDVVYGAAMHAERWYDVHDQVTIEPFALAGVVEKVSPRSTKLRGLNGETIWVHNSQIVGVKVARQAARELLVEIYASDLDGGARLVEEAASLLPTGPTLILVPPTITAREQVARDLFRLEARATTVPGREWLIEARFCEIVSRLDAEAGVLAYPPIVLNADEVAAHRFSGAVAPILEPTA